MNYVSVITQKGQVTIPVDIRRFLKLKPYGKVVFVRTEDQVVIKPSQSFYALKGSVKSKRKFSDREANREVEEFIGKEYEEEATPS